MKKIKWYCKDKNNSSFIGTGGARDLFYIHESEGRFYAIRYGKNNSTESLPSSATLREAALRCEFYNVARNYLYEYDFDFMDEASKSNFFDVEVLSEKGENNE